MYKPKSLVSALFVFSFLFCMMFSTMVVSAWCMDFTAEITQDTINKHFTGKLFVKDGLYRMILNPSNGGQEESLTVIVDRQKGKTIVLPLQSNKYEEVENFTLPAYIVDPFQSVATLEKIAQKKMIGAETLAGFLCQHYAYYDQDFKLADVWYSKDLGSFPIKAHIVSGRNDGNINIKTNIGDTKIELNNIKIEPVDAEMFSLPSGAIKAEARQKEKNKMLSVTQTIKGSSPWGRRIGRGGEIRVKTDINRPVKITLEYLTDGAVCSYVAISRGKRPEQAKAIEKGSPEKGRYRKITIDKDKRIEQVVIRVSKGMVFAKVVNEEDPFSLGKERKIKEGYLIKEDLQGIDIDPARKLFISITGDNQDGPDSEVSLVCYRKQYEDKTFEKDLKILNGKTEKWEFSPDDNIKTLEISVGKYGAVKYCVEQPALVITKTGTPDGQSLPKKIKPPKKIVYTAPGTTHGSSKIISCKGVGGSLSKEDTSAILKALNSSDVNAKDKDGNTALSWARTERRGEQLFEKQNRKAIIELLEAKGAK